MIKLEPSRPRNQYQSFLGFGRSQKGTFTTGAKFRDASSLLRGIKSGSIGPLKRAPVSPKSQSIQPSRPEIGLRCASKAQTTVHKQKRVVQSSEQPQCGRKAVLLGECRLALGDEMAFSTLSHWETTEWTDENY